MIDVRLIRLSTSEFARLQLARDPRTGTPSYSIGALSSILSANQVDPAGILGDEDRVAGILFDWYIAHRETGGDANPAMERLIAEVLAEDEFGEDRIQRGSSRPQ
jgi:hypothetical protein